MHEWTHSVRQYHDSTGLKVDAIVEAADGRWAALEVKPGSGMVDEAAGSVRKFADRVDTQKRGKPAALGVIIGTGYGCVQEDGVVVIPIGAFGP